MLTFQPAYYTTYSTAEVYKRYDPQELLNHDYAKSRFLKSNVLKNYLEIRGTLIEDEIQAQFQAYQDPNLLII